MTRCRLTFAHPGFVLLGALCAPALASDGVLEINQTCAAGPGCFLGDAPQFPVTITPAPGGAGSGSYRLTSNLTIANGNTTAIQITASAVALDLGGFRIAGPAVCSGVPVTSCTNTGTGVGVNGANDVTVKNGTITGMGFAAVNLSYSARVEGLNIFHCGVGGGILVTDLAVLRGNLVTSTSGDGIRCRDRCVVSENSATGHFADGIEVTSGTVNGSSASLNGGNGGRFVGGVSYAHNSFSGNSGPDVSGGHAGGGNACEDGSCSARGTRRYYLTPSPRAANTVLSACAVSFHPAHLAELLMPSELEYDTRLGQTNTDSGEGPTQQSGWIRTGSPSLIGSVAGDANCAAWTTTSAAEEGSAVRFAANWEIAHGFGSPWEPSTVACNFVRPVWCVED